MWDFSFSIQCLAFISFLITRTSASNQSLSSSHTSSEPPTAKMHPNDINFISKYLTSWQLSQGPQGKTIQCFTCALDPASARTPSYLPLTCQESPTECRVSNKETRRRPGLGLFSRLPELVDKGKRFLSFGISITNNFAINLKVNLTQQDVSYMMSMLQQDLVANPQRC